MTDSREPPLPSERPGSDLPDGPTVLDWVKSLLRGKPLPLPTLDEPPPYQAASPEDKSAGGSPAWADSTAEPAGVHARQPVPREASTAAAGAGRSTAAERIGFSGSYVRFPLALGLALLAQYGLELRPERVLMQIFLYLLAAALAGWAAWAGDLRLEMPSEATLLGTPLTFRPVLLIGAALLSVVAFFGSSGNLFRQTTVLAWVGAILLMVLSLWEGNLAPRRTWDRWVNRLRAPRISITLDAWSLAVLGVVGLTLFFRFYRLSAVPIEMVSDHAEKLLDVYDVVTGTPSIFFPRNTGREAMQFYMAAATAGLLGTGLSFLTLKIGTAMAGWITLPFIYLFGKEVGGRKVGLLAFFLAGVAYWPNVISRVGLRFPLYPLFVAPALYFLARGLRRRNRNDLLLCGLAVGMGLHGYTPARVIPLAVALGVLLFLLHRNARGQRWAVFSWLIGAGVVALVVLLPLLRVSFEMPDMILFRILSRVGETERPLPGPAILIFLSNLWNALRMFGWDNGEVWVNSIPHRPALDWITAALFHLGVLFTTIRYLRRRNWLDLFVLLSIPVLMLPSIMSLAFPSENPAPNRASGAIVPVFVLAALPLAAWFDWAGRRWRTVFGRGAWVSIGLVLLGGVIALNYNLVFSQYADLFRRSAWPTSVAGAVVRDFAESIGTYDTAHVVAYPHWWDTRLVGMQAGQVTRDYAIWPDDFSSLSEERRAQLFLLNPQDVDGLSRLEAQFPGGTLNHRTSPEEGHDFLIYFVPAALGSGEILPTPEP